MVTVNESNEIHAFKVVVTDEPLFTTIKADKRSRIQETAISAEAMLARGTLRPVARRRTVAPRQGFGGRLRPIPEAAQNAADERDYGYRGGRRTARESGWRKYARPNKTIKTFWRTAIDEPALKEPSLEVVLPEFATLSELSSSLLKHQALPGLWSSDAITVQNLYDYFAGGNIVNIPKEGLRRSPSPSPNANRRIVNAAVLQAVEQGTLWLTSAPASIFNEPVPPGVLSASASLRPPPRPDSCSGVDGRRNPRGVAGWQNERARACDSALSNKERSNIYLGTR